MISKNKMVHLERAERLARANPQLVSFIKELYETRDYTNRAIATMVFDKFIIRVDLGLIAPIAQYGGAKLRTTKENMQVYHREVALGARKFPKWNQ